MKTASHVDWQAAQAAVARVGSDAAAVLRGIRRPEAHAVGEWNVIQLAAHLSLTVDGITAMALGGGGVLSDISALSTLTGAFVAGETERDPGALADRLEAGVERFLSVMADATNDERRMWVVEGIELSLSGLTCHVLNELTVHGHDLARAEGVPWSISRADAALVVCGFFLPSMGALGRALVNQEVAGNLRATFDLRVRGGCRWTLRFDGGNLTVAPGGPTGPVDCHLSVDPVAFLLVGWRRIGQWPAIARCQLLGWGRRPWLGVQLSSMIVTP